MRRIAGRVAGTGSDVPAIKAVSVRTTELACRNTNAAEHRRGKTQRLLLAEHRQMPRMQALADRHAHLQLAQALIDRLDLGGLLPRRRHQRLLVFLDDLRPERRGRAPARIEIQLVEPVRGAGRHERAPRMPPAVERRREQRIGRWRDHLVQARLIDDVLQRGFKRRRGGIGPEHGALVPVSGINAPSTFTVVAGIEPGSVKPGCRSRRCAGPIPAATHAQAGAPAIRSRRLRRCGTATSSKRAIAPARARSRSASTPARVRSCAVELGVGNRQTEPGLATELERRHDTGDVVRVRRQQSRAHEPRQ